jgi:hypothetical protein
MILSFNEQHRHAIQLHQMKLAQALDIHAEQLSGDRLSAAVVDRLSGWIA